MKTEARQRLLDALKAYRESFKDLKGHAQVCATTVGMGQNMLLADRSAMDHILVPSARSELTVPSWRRRGDDRNGTF